MRIQKGFWRLSRNIRKCRSHNLVPSFFEERFVKCGSWSSSYQALFSSDFERTGCLQTLRGNMAKLRENGSNADNADAIFRETVAKCSDLLSRLRDAYSPVQKLDHFLGVVKAVLQSVSGNQFNWIFESQ